MVAARTLCLASAPLLAALLALPKRPGLGELSPVDLRGKTFVVTGPTSGFGKWHVEILMQWNASLVLAARDTTKLQALAKELEALNPLAPAPQTFQLELSSLDSVVAFAKAYTGPVDVLVHNAGIMGAEPFPKTGDGFDEVLQVDYLSTFVLTDLLLPRVEASPAGRIVHVSGGISEKFGRLNISAMRHNGVAGWNVSQRQVPVMGNLMGSYSDAKLAQILFSSALARRLKRPAVTHALHPAVIPTSLGSEALAQKPPVARFLSKMARDVMKRVLTLFGVFQTREDAPKTQVFVSTHPDLQKASGLYYSAMAPPLTGCGREARLCGSRSPGPRAEDAKLQEELWEVSCEILAPWLASDGMCSRSARPVEE